jgi:hypothetical protein
MPRLPKSQSDRSQSRMLIVKVCETAFAVLVLAISNHAQQIASVDLAHPPVALADPHPMQQKDEFPESCGKPGVGFADGVAVTDDHEPRKIDVEFSSVSDTRLVIGRNVEGTIKLKNVGTRPIEIPWSTDFRTTQNGQDPNFRSWEIGMFRLQLKSAKNGDAELKNTSQVLFSAKLVSGSTLTVRPGEWITAQISFKVEPQEGSYEHLTQGQFELSAEWYQTARARRIKDCGLMLGYYSYGGYYQQSSRRIPVTVEDETHDTTKKISKGPTDLRPH